MEPVQEPEATSHQRAVVYLLDSDRSWQERLLGELAAAGISARGFGDLSRLADQLEDHAPGCIVTELRMPSGSVFDVLKMLRERGSELEILVATSFASVTTTVQAMKRGVFSVVEKTHELGSLIAEIREATEKSHQKLAARKRFDDGKRIFEALSAEEHLVMELAIEGHPNRQISESLSISPRTVDRRRHSALRKMSAESVAQYAVLRTRLEELGPMLGEHFEVPKREPRQNSPHALADGAMADGALADGSDLSSDQLSS
ncbi:MAG: response regulator [Planctomycetota bacterium]